jgi:hypothetical protein
MHSLLATLAAVCCALLLLLPGKLVAAELQETPTTEEIRALIDMLVSPKTAAPNPITYKDLEASKDQREAFLKLRQVGLAAFPLLIERFDDDRYSFTFETPSSDMNYSVGRACQAVLRDYITLGTYDLAMPNGADDPMFIKRRPSYVAHFNLFDKRTAQEWWEQRKNKSLKELQLETLEWTIAEEAKNPKDFTDRERKFLDTCLKNLRDRPEARKLQYFPFPK